ncbi:hypothetical protein D9756_006834 [Leucocoprinus leucothites]|uniref:Uncharacterized protein n=1 Tax=Leucocoprinus leucothites TaxID=201217 RepID=A0A8H5G249_9AGAR|nr:hypothetical protein D9756_006834 [Leucoagaricus leucothites]
MEDLLDDLDLFNDSGFSVPAPFQSTARYRGKVYICSGLEKSGIHRMVLEPIIPSPRNVWTSDDSSSDDEEVIVPRNFHAYKAVSGGFGPDGGDSRLELKVNKEVATTPALREILLITEKGKEILIRPRCQPRTKVLRGCVELAISEWMKAQLKLPHGHPDKHHVEWTTMPYNLDGEDRNVRVWLWRGLNKTQ